MENRTEVCILILPLDSHVMPTASTGRQRHGHQRCAFRGLQVLWKGHIYKVIDKGGHSLFLHTAPILDSFSLFPNISLAPELSVRQTTWCLSKTAFNILIVCVCMLCPHWTLSDQGLEQLVHTGPSTCRMKFTLQDINEEVVVICLALVPLLGLKWWQRYDLLLLFFIFVFFWV